MANRNETVTGILNILVASILVVKIKATMVANGGLLITACRPHDISITIRDHIRFVYKSTMKQIAVSGLTCWHYI